MSSASDKPLTVPLLVRGALDGNLIGGMFFMAGLLVVIGCVSYFRNGYDSLSLGICLLLALVFATPAGIIALILWPQRRWLEVTLTGFVITQRGQRKIYSDDQVQAVWLGHKVNSEGITRRRLLLEVGQDEDADRIDCRYQIFPLHPDPLAAFMERILRLLARRARAALSSGAALTGYGWRLDAAGLAWRGQCYPLARISHAAIYQDRVCIWKDEDERPFAFIPAGSRNARVLAVLLQDETAARPELAQPSPKQPLGRILLERRGHDLSVGILLLLFFVPLVLLLVRMSWTVSSQHGPAYELLALFFSPGVLAAVLLIWRGWGRGLRFHQFGVSQADGKQMRYDEIAVMTWKSTGDFTFEPLPGLGRTTMHHRSMTVRQDADLIAMRDYIAGVIGWRWVQALSQGPIPWTRQLRFLPGGLEYRPSGFFGSGEPITVPYHLTSWRIGSGTLLLFVSGRSRPVVRERLDTANLFPGLAMLNILYQRMQQPAQPAPAPAPALPDEHVLLRAPDSRMTGGRSE